LVSAVRHRSAERPVIAALGTVTHHKNIALLLEVARRRPDWFFAVAGTVHWKRLSRPEAALLGEAASWKNVLIHPESISDRILNSMSSQSDVLYGCYLDFPHSSNKLTKACLFRVPVVVAEGDYMEEVVREYGIGAACDPTDSQSLERAIAALLSQGHAEPRWQAYLERNSVESLGGSVEWLFE
jgi:glycosyltransferase involved in cell wall biosynthesis